ncbi:MAG TPA: glycosyltransferase, partial [Elusimicrobiota bacterium]|nr:glycosyltransferase [Elusimicrobiota bacterium]
FWGHRTLPGWTSVAVLVGGVGSLQLLVTGLIGLYLAKIYDETKQRPLYLIRDLVGVESPPREA